MTEKRVVEVSRTDGLKLNFLGSWIGGETLDNCGQGQSLKAFN